MALTVAKVEYAIKQTAGNISQAAKALGVSRTAIYDKIHASPKLRQVLNDVREELVDIAESALRHNVVNGDNSAIFYTLNNAPEAKRRGWGPRQEITGAEGEQLTVKVIKGVTLDDL